MTDGETNASLRARATTSRRITPERALELLAERRAKGPPQKRSAAKRAPAKRAPAKRKKPS